MNLIAPLMLAAGLAIALVSAYRGAIEASRWPRDPERALAIMRGFRRAVLGLAIAGVGAGWLWEVRGLVTLSLLIGCEELLESSVMIRALRDWPVQPADGDSSSQSSSHRRTVLSAEADTNQRPSPLSRSQVSLSG
jgi:hypothetical protein